MKFFINGQETNEADFIQGFYSESLSAESQNLMFIYLRALAENLLDEETHKLMDRNIAIYYLNSRFKGTNTVVINNSRFDVLPENQDGSPHE